MLNYFVHVLGIKFINQESLSSGLFDEQAPKKVLFIFAWDLSPEAESLFQKMVEAMKLSLGEVHRLVLNSDSLKPEHFCKIHQLSSLCIISFVPQSVATLHQQTAPHMFIIETDGPDILLVKPQLKKKVWLELQKAIAFMQEKFAPRGSSH